MKKIIIILLSFLLLGLGIYALTKVAPLFLSGFERKTELTQLPVAQEFTLPDLEGNRVKLSDFRGRIALILFWTSWNEASVEQLGILRSYTASLPRSDVVVLAVNSEENRETVRAVSGEEVQNVKILMDQEGEAGVMYEIGTLPLTLIIDKTGLIRGRFVGPLTSAEIERQISGL